MESENPVWLGEYIWEETPLDGGPPKAGPLPAEVLSMFRPQQCLLCGIKTANMQTAYTHYESKGHFKKVTHHMTEKYNALGSLKSNKEKFDIVRCDICNVELSSRIVYLQHYDGKQHLKNLKKRGFKPLVSEEVPPGETTNPPVPEVDGAAQETPSLLKLGDYVCALCNVTTATRGQMQVHNNGSRHMKNVAKLADGELRDFYMTNGNCEPMENDEGDGAKDNGSDQASQAQTPANPQPPEIPPSQPQGYNGSYVPPGPPMDPSMMQQYPPQMPYGQYPQYPMQYDYNAWGQANMYPGYSGPPPYNGQYGPGPYGPPSQQYPYQYPQGPSAEYYSQQQQFHSGQQPYQGQQYNQAQYNPEQQYNYQDNSHQQNPPTPSEELANISPNKPQELSKTSKQPQESVVNMTEGTVANSPSAVPFIMPPQSSDEQPPGVDGPPGIDKNDDPFKPLTAFSSIIEAEAKDNKTPFTEVEAEVEPASPPRTLLDLIRENNKMAKQAKEEVVKKLEAPAIDVPTDLPPIPGLDLAPDEGKPTIITWTDGSKEGEDDKAEEVASVENAVIAPGEVVPPPPHPLNPPIHFLPPSPESEAVSSEKLLEKLDPEPEVPVSSVPYTQAPVSSMNAASYSQINVSAHPQQSQSNLQPHYSHPPVPSAPAQPFPLPHSLPPHPQTLLPPPPQSYTYPVNPQAYAGYNSGYISNPPVSYAPVPAANYPMYPQVLTEPPQPYQKVQPVQAALPQHTPPKIPHVLPKPEQTVVSVPSVAAQASDDKSENTKEDDSKIKEKPKINSFFRRAAEKMFKEAKEKKIKEEAKKMEPHKDPEPLRKPKEAGKDAIIIVPPLSGLKSMETTDTVNQKVRANESVSETDNDVGSEPGEIIDKTPKVEKIVEKQSVQTAEAETPKEKSKFDFGSRKSSENRRKRSFRVRRSSVSRSRSRSRPNTPKRRGRRRSRSWSPSPEKSPVGYYQRNNFQSYYGNDTRYWRNDNQFRSYQDWDDSHNDRYAKRRNERDEFGRERKWKEEKKKEERKKKKRKSRKRSHSASVSPPRKTKELEQVKKKSPSPSPPRDEAVPAKPTQAEDPKPATVSLMQRLKGGLPNSSDKPAEFPKKGVPAKLVEEVKNIVEVRDVLIRPDVDSDEAREVEKEEQEILKKVALIKKKLMEKEDEKPVKKKRKKEKAKRRKKRSKSSSSSDSDSSSSDSSSSSSSTSASSDSSSSTSAGSEPKSKRIVESLLSKLSRQAATGEAPFDLSMLPGLVKKKKKKSDVSKKKKKKDKKRKKKKKKEKKTTREPPLQVLSAFITPTGAYHCKCCNLTTSSGSSFLEHLISEKHKLLCKLISTK